MGALDDAAAFAVDPDLIPPLTAAICAAAVNIASEDDATDGHIERINLARAVLWNPTQLAATFAWAVSSNPTVVGKWTSGDHEGAINDLAFVLGSVWNAVAGA